MKCANEETQPIISHDAFQQDVFDNTDANIKSLDGKGSIHILGSKCGTPAKSINTPFFIPRDKNKKWDIHLNNIPIKVYKKTTSVQGLASIPVKRFTPTSHDIDQV